MSHITWRTDVAHHPAQHKPSSPRTAGLTSMGSRRAVGAQKAPAGGAGAPSSPGARRRGV